jgi:hypothetical protein
LRASVRRLTNGGITWRATDERSHRYETTTSFEMFIVVFDFKISFFCSICLLLRRSGFCRDYGPSLPNASPPLDVAGFLARHTLIGCDIGMSCSFYSVFVLSLFSTNFH